MPQSQHLRTLTPRQPVLNATFRARLPSLVRRTQNLARTVVRLRAEMFWVGVVYNFCTVHTSLSAIPAVAAALTDHTWSVQDTAKAISRCPVVLPGDNFIR